MQLSNDKPMIVYMLVDVLQSRNSFTLPNFSSIEYDLHTPHNRKKRSKARI